LSTFTSFSDKEKNATLPPDIKKETKKSNMVEIISTPDIAGTIFSSVKNNSVG
jgi:hypothetical protein